MSYFLSGIPQKELFALMESVRFVRGILIAQDKDMQVDDSKCTPLYVQ